MQTKHTPEKWVVDECPDARDHWTIRPDDGSGSGDIEAEPIATVYAGRRAANVAALAPELAEALRELLDMTTADYDSAYDDEREIMNKAGTLLARLDAEG